MVPGWHDTPKHAHYDVVIVGGAMHGTAAAWFLADNADFDGRVLVVERDPTYALCSTTHTNSCIRQQFSTELNIRISRFAADYVRNFREYLGGDARVPRITLQSFGYLYLASDEPSAAALRASQELQVACGAGTRILDRDELAREYPFLNLDGIVAGSHNPVDEGYFEGAALFDWWRRLARERGVEYVANAVVSMSRDATGERVESVTLTSGERVGCNTVINASGPRALLTARMAGIEIPVEPRKRHTFVFDAARPLDRVLPLTIDPAGPHVRSDGQYYMAGCPPDDDVAVDYDDFTPDDSLWEEKAWPLIAHRIPQFEAVKLVNSWVGHYAYNTLDQNAIVGPHDTVSNLLFANGFSGHGLQQAPAMGRGLAEWITYGEYRSLDLSPLGYGRIARGEPFAEHAII